MPYTGWNDFYDNAVLGTAYFAYGRYADQAAIDALPEPGAKLPYARAMWRYMRGEGAARRGDLTALTAETAGVSLGGDDMKAFKTQAAAGRAMVEVARLVLTGRAAMLQHRYADAAAAYARAAGIEDAKLGGFADPPFWWYPVRRSYAAALLADGKPGAAAVEVRKAMVRWPYDPVGLRILADAERASGDAEGADQEIALARRNWSGDIAALPAALM